MSSFGSSLRVSSSRDADRPIIRLRNVTKRFGSAVAVNDVSLDVQPGRCLGWLGPNGSGKTTLIRMMLGLARPTSGHIELRGHPIPRELRLALSRVGGIVEEPRFYPYLSGRANLQVWAAHLGPAAGQRVEPVLQRVGLAERGDDRVKTYSLGMRQRLGVARALLNDPELLVLDEPTNGLDPAGMVEFRQMIRGLVEHEGRTVFISSHILDEVQKMADDIAIVQHGRLLALDSVGRILADGRHSVVIRVDDPTRAAALLTATAYVGDVQAAPDRTLRITLRTDRDTRSSVPDLSDPAHVDALLIELNRCLVSNGVGVAEIRQEAESLEQRFLNLTGQPALEPGAHTMPVPHRAAHQEALR
jgi:ABC-2 type transport system ATP-binding protein